MHDIYEMVYIIKGGLLILAMLGVIGLYYPYSKRRR